MLCERPAGQDRRQKTAGREGGRPQRVFYKTNTVRFIQTRRGPWMFYEAVVFIGKTGRTGKPDHIVGVLV